MQESSIFVPPLWFCALRKAQTSLHRCAGTTEPSPLAYVISTKTSCAGPYLLHYRKSGFDLRARLYTNKFAKNNCSTKINKNTQTTWFVRHAAQSQPTPYLRPLSVRQQNAVGMAFRLRADSDQILHSYRGDGIEPMILGWALNIVMLH